MLNLMTDSTQRPVLLLPLKHIMCYLESVRHFSWFEGNECVFPLLGAKARVRQDSMLVVLELEDDTTPIASEYMPDNYFLANYKQHYLNNSAGHIRQTSIGRLYKEFTPDSFYMALEKLVNNGFEVTAVEGCLHIGKTGMFNSVVRVEHIKFQDLEVAEGVNSIDKVVVFPFDDSDLGAFLLFSGVALC